MKDVNTRFVGGYHESSNSFFKPRKTTESINMNDYKLHIKELKTEEDLNRYKSELDTVRNNKEYFQGSSIDCLPQQMIFSFIAALVSTGVARLFTDKTWAMVCGAIVGCLVFAMIDWQYENADDRQEVRNCRKKIRFLKKAIREYESSKAQQSNVINNAAINTK